MKYKYKKITPDNVKEIKKLKEQGWFYKDIAKKFNVSVNTIKYHLIPEVKEYDISRAIERNNNLTDKQKKEKTKKQQPYMKEYMNKRYKNDEEFKKSFIKMVQKNFNKRQKIWKSKGLCHLCGRERIDTKFVNCERCRKAMRKRGGRYRERVKKRNP